MLRMLGTSIVRIGLIVSVMCLQVHLWFSDSGYRRYREITKKIDTIEEDNKKVIQDNTRLEKAVEDLKQDGKLLSSNAREHLGMIGPNETLYQVNSN